jgi:hypothetical protein
MYERKRLAAMALGLALGGPAMAGQFDWTLTGSGVTGSGNLTTDGLPGNVLSFTGDINGNPVSLLTATSDFNFDNILLASAPFVTSDGILVSYLGGDGNIFSDPVGYPPGPNDFWACTPSCYPVQVNDAIFAVSAVPAPGGLPLMLMAVGVLGLVSATSSRHA